MTTQCTPTPPDSVSESASAQPEAHSRMTIHVYTVDLDGTVIEDRGVQHYDEAGFVPIGLGQEYPPCICPKCRVKPRSAG